MELIGGLRLSGGAVFRKKRGRPCINPDEEITDEAFVKDHSKGERLRSVPGCTGTLEERKNGSDGEKGSLSENFMTPCGAGRKTAKREDNRNLGKERTKRSHLPGRGGSGLRREIYSAQGEIPVRGRRERMWEDTHQGGLPSEIHVVGYVLLDGAKRSRNIPFSKKDIRQF